VRLLLNKVPRLLRTIAMLNARAENISAGDPLSRESVVDPLKEINDCKALLKTLTLGLKTVVWSALNIRVQPPWPSRSRMRSQALRSSGLRAPVQLILQVVLNVLIYVGRDIIPVGNVADACKRDQAGELRRVGRQVRVDGA
jgi:hypothetical protein